MTDATTNRKANFLVAVFSQIGWPLLWGMAAWVGFYLLLEYGVIANATIQRYFAGHPVEYIETALFFVGVAALVLKLLDVWSQQRSIGKVVMPSVPEGGNKPEETGELLEWIDGLPEGMQHHYLVRRLKNAIGFVQAKGTADDLDEQVRYLSEEDYGRQHDGYALVRLVIWAIPILGFLGTVIGITMAISQLSAEQLTESTTALTGSLSIAFDTTTVALGLSIVLMFAQFLVERFEGELLTAVNDCASAELMGRFEQLGSHNDPLVRSVRKMSDELIATSKSLVEEQSKLWQGTIEDAHARWAEMNEASTEQLQTALTTSIDHGLEQHTRRLTEAEEAAARRLTETEAAAAARQEQAESDALARVAASEESSMQRLADIQKTTLDRLSEAEAASTSRLAETEAAAAERAKLLTGSLSEAIVQYAEVVKSQQAELVRQGDTMRQAIEATGKVTELQEALNKNLSSLAGANHFEDTLLSLSAAIHVLTSRIHAGGKIELADTTTKERAA